MSALVGFREPGDDLPSLAELDDLLYSAADAERELGIPAGTVRAWAARKRIYSAGLDRSGRPMYSGLKLIRLHSGSE